MVPVEGVEDFGEAELPSFIPPEAVVVFQGSRDPLR